MGEIASRRASKREEHQQMCSSGGYREESKKILSANSDIICNGRIRNRPFKKFLNMYRRKSINNGRYTSHLVLIGKQNRKAYQLQK